MNIRFRFFGGLMCVALLAAHVPVYAKSAATSAPTDGSQRYIVVLDDLPLAAYDGREMYTPERDINSTRLPATANRFTGASKLDVHSSRSRQYLQFLAERQAAFQGEAALKLGRKLNTVFSYRNAVNGFATDLTPDELKTLRNMPGVKAVRIDEKQYVETDSGPNWIGADNIHNGSAGFAATGGEGIVIGVIDSGINWDHNSFSDPGEGVPPGNNVWDHVNPYPAQLDLCLNEEVLCNDKLVGVYDFVEDNPQTEEVEEFNNGKDNTGHGSHTASTAAGNPLNLTINGIPTRIAGVAPNANIISYRVCYVGDPDDTSNPCQGSAILKAIDQAITDGVDVINHSIGGTAFDPWSPGSSTLAFLNARAAGIFVATSAGNKGPNASSIGSPANAPWIMAVGNATHDRILASLVENLSGGNTAPPDDLIGVSLTPGIGIRKIVHAKDYGYASCAIGEPESGLECDDNTGASNPFAQNTFNGEIVVCDRGVYGRVEKGKNVMLAGAGGYILLNTEEFGESTVADDHCLPATHVGLEGGNQLRAWLDSGSGHQGSISGFAIFNIPEVGDLINFSSSRGPNLPPVADIMKPDVIAPGTSILAATDEDVSFAFFTGTSMSSPHMAGSGALLKAVHPDWTPAMISSALTMTATPVLADDFDGSAATVHKRGGGRPQLEKAVNAGIFLQETTNGFLAADPDAGGNPKDLNLPGLIDTNCRKSCSFQRRVTDMAGGSSWAATAQGFPGGVSVSVSPNNFNLSNGGSRSLSINVDLGSSGVIGEWVYGEVRLSSNGLPDAIFPVAVFADGGELPEQWTISSDQISGSQDFALSQLAAMPDATYTSGGLVVPTLTVENLPEDPTNDTINGDQTGLMTVWNTIPENTLWFHNETFQSTAADLDLYVGRDRNNDGIAQDSEVLCSSLTPGDLELCDLFAPVAGSYWTVVQNFTATNSTDEATLETAVVANNTNSRLSATGNGIIAEGAAQTVRLSWDNVAATPGTELIGAVGIGTNRETPNNIGIIPVRFTKTAVAAPSTLVLMNGVSRGVTVNGGGEHKLTFIDIPPGASSLTVTAVGDGAVQSENLEIELYRMNFDAAFGNIPFASTPNTSGSPLASASGSNGNGPSVTVNGASLTPGRWYAVIKNNRGFHAAVEIRADVQFNGGPFALRAGLWQPAARASNQGFDFNTTGNARAFLWYTYGDDGQPGWYLASGAEPEGNIWVAELLRFTNDGLQQQFTPVGHVSVTTLSEDDSIFSFVLFGEEGSERMRPSAAARCPTVNNSKQSYTGIWSRAAAGVGGASALVLDTSQAFVHYIYDATGSPRWMIATVDPQSSSATNLRLFQYRGYCAVCADTGVEIDDVGQFTRNFSSQSSVNWRLNYSLLAPLNGTINRSDNAGKLTAPLACQ